MKLIQTKDYLLLIDEEAEIKEGGKLSFYKNNHGSEILCISYLSKTGVVFHKLDVDPVEEYGSIEGGLTPLKENISKIIAYYPLTKEAKELDLPLLPPFEDNFDLKQEIIRWYDSKSGTTLINDPSLNTLVDKAQSSNKQFSLEDMKKALSEAFKVSQDGYQITADEIIQSLFTQQLPKKFIPEYDLMNEGYNKPEDYPYQECKVLKTITNSEGKEEIVGTYKY